MPNTVVTAFLSVLSVLGVTGSGGQAGDPQCRNVSWVPRAVAGMPTCGISDMPTIRSKGAPLLGGNVTLTCVYGQASQRPPDDALYYHWFKDGQSVAGKHSGTLTLHNLSCSDQADYTCRGVDPQSGECFCRSYEHPIVVMVPPEVSIKQGDGRVHKIMEGSVLKLNCELANNPQPPVNSDGYRWKYRPLAPGKNGCFSSNSDASNPNDRDVTTQLTFWSVTRCRSGLYSCYVTNDPHNISGIPKGIASVEVQVQYLDSIIAVSQLTSNVEVAGKNVTLMCQTDSVPTANLTWLHKGRILRTVQSNEDVYSFPATGCQDSGEYQCRADNDVVNKSVSNKTKVTVECPPSGDGSAETEVVKFVGEELTLSVFSSGFPPPVYSWSGPGLRTGEHSRTLTLVSLQRSQAGDYTVNVSNQHGWFAQSFRVTVIDRVASGGEVGAGADVHDTVGKEMEFWLKVGGGFLGVLLCLALICKLVLRKRQGCCGRQRRRSADTDEHLYAGLYSSECYDSTGRRRSIEVADYTSGESEGQYWSIDSADLFWQPQAVQPQDSLSQDSGKHDSDIPASPAPIPKLPSPRRPRHEVCHVASDVTAQGDIVQPLHPRGDNAMDSQSSEAMYTDESCWAPYSESDQESGNSEPYCVCHVISGDSGTLDSVVG